MFTKEEVIVWETEKDQELQDRHYPNYTENHEPFDPHKERIYKWRRTEKWGYHYNKELPKERRYLNRSFRQKMKRELYNETYYHLQAKDYKTYGWMTW